MTIVSDTTPSLLPDICRRLAERMVGQFERYERFPSPHLSPDDRNTIRNAYRLLAMHKARHLDANTPTGVLGATSDNVANVEYDLSTDASERLRTSIETAIAKSFPGKKDTFLFEMEKILGALAGREKFKESVDPKQVAAAKELFVELNRSLAEDAVA